TSTRPTCARPPACWTSARRTAQVCTDELNATATATSKKARIVTAPMKTSRTGFMDGGDDTLAPMKLPRNRENNFERSDASEARRVINDSLVARTAFANS